MKRWNLDKDKDKKKREMQICPWKSDGNTSIKL